MMFLLRVAFWLVVICLLLPSGRDDNKRLLSSAEKTVADMRGFCDRNPDVCADARSAMSVLLRKVRSGTESLQYWLSTISDEKTPPDQPAVDPGTFREIMIPDQRSQTPKAAVEWRNSLNTADRQVPWRGPPGS
jgi:hypothetical protein